MDVHDGSSPQERFQAYAADLASILGHADRVRPFEDYCVGLLSTRSDASAAARCQSPDAPSADERLQS
jgi:SRSO17 transposase